MNSDCTPNLREQPGFLKGTASTPKIGMSKERWFLVAEIVFIFAWALYLGREYLNFDIQFMVGGSEVEMSTQSHYFWENLFRCGTCVFWNDSINGGNPAFIEMHGAPLHPLVLISTLLFGGINGTKVVMLGALIMSGFAMWWLGRVLKLGSVARLWSAALGVAGGYLAGKFSIGGVPVPLSIAAVTLTLPPLVDLFWNRNRHAVVWLGVTMAMAWTAGNGYVQIVFILSWVLASLVLFFYAKIGERPFYFRLLQAAGFSIAFAGLLIVPLIHFFPFFTKFGDSGVGVFQTLQYLPLNLVIRNLDFLQSEELMKSGILFINANYIGWIPVILAIFSLTVMKKTEKGLFGFFWLSIGLVFLVSSLEFFQFVQRFFPDIAALRNLPMATSLAVPPIIALGAICLDRLIHRDWLMFSLTFGENKTRSLSLFQAILIVVAISSVIENYSFSKQFYYSAKLNPSDTELNWLHVDSAEWVGPLGSNWIPYLLEQRQKLVVFRPWSWKNRDDPAAFLALIHNPQNNPDPNVIQRIGEVDIVKNPEAEYAFLQMDDRTIPCKAKSTGGQLEVECDSPQPGILIVRENFWDGWKVWVDGKKAELLPSRWLQTNSLSGRHVYHFRYLPWDTWVGLALAIGGVIVAILFLRHSPKKEENAESD